MSGLKVGQRVRFRDSGAERVGIIRSFQLQDWADQPVLIVDIDPPLRGPIVNSIRRIEQDRVIEVVGALKP